VRRKRRSTSIRSRPARIIKIKKKNQTLDAAPLSGETRVLQVLEGPPIAKTGVKKPKERNFAAGGDRATKIL